MDKLSCLMDRKRGEHEQGVSVGKQRDHRAGGRVPLPWDLAGQAAWQGLHSALDLREAARNRAQLNRVLARRLPAEGVGRDGKKILPAQALSTPKGNGCNGINGHKFVCFVPPSDRHDPGRPGRGLNISVESVKPTRRILRIPPIPVVRKMADLVGTHSWAKGTL